MNAFFRAVTSGLVLACGAGQTVAQASSSSAASMSITIDGYLWGGIIHETLPPFAQLAAPPVITPLNDGEGYAENMAEYRGNSLGDVLNPGGAIGDAGTQIFTLVSSMTTSRPRGEALSIASAIAALSLENTSTNPADTFRVLISVTWSADASATGIDPLIDSSNAIGAAFADVTNLPRLGGTAGRVVYPAGGSMSAGDGPFMGEIEVLAGQTIELRATSDTTSFARSIPTPASVLTVTGLAGLRRRRVLQTALLG